MQNLKLNPITNWFWRLPELDQIDQTIRREEKSCAQLAIQTIDHSIDWLENWAEDKIDLKIGLIRDNWA